MIVKNSEILVPSIETFGNTFFLFMIDIYLDIISDAFFDTDAGEVLEKIEVLFGLRWEVEVVLFLFSPEHICWLIMTIRSKELIIINNHFKYHFESVMSHASLICYEETIYFHCHQN